MKLTISQTRSATLLLALSVVCLLWVTLAEAQRPSNRSRAKRDRGPGERTADRIGVGDPAPDFQLSSLDGKSKTQLSDHRGERPVALIFGSYT